jgi:serine/threonine protein kinase
MFRTCVAIDLLERLLQFDPSKRITAAEALQHSYFTSAGLGSNAGGALPVPYPSTQQSAPLPQPAPPGQYNYPQGSHPVAVYNVQVAPMAQPQQTQPQQQPQQQQNGFGQYPVVYAHPSR